MNFDEMLEYFTVTIGMDSMIKYLTFGISILAVSTILPLLYILKLEPKKIFL